MILVLVLHEGSMWLAASASANARLWWSVLMDIKRMDSRLSLNRMTVGHTITILTSFCPFIRHSIKLNF